MTEDEVHSAVVRWVSKVTGAKTIKDHLGGVRPPLPYAMVNFLTRREVREHEQALDLAETGHDNSEGFPIIAASPVIEVEWHYSVHAYGASPTGILRPIVSAAKLYHAVESLLPLTMHEISQIRNVPDWIENQWEPRAQMDVFVRGLTRDGFLIDTIEAVGFDIAKA